MQESTQKQSIRLKAKLFRGFSDPSRLLILETLRQGAMTVTEIVNATRLSQPNVSNHLSCLRDCGLVDMEQQGRYVVYRLNGEQVGQLLDLADRILADFAQGIYACTRYNVQGDPDGTSENN
jgi:DNA-binding transcriptional ArsR family regulator